MMCYPSVIIQLFRVSSLINILETCQTETNMAQFLISDGSAFDLHCLLRKRVYRDQSHSSTLFSIFPNSKKRESLGSGERTGGCLIYCMCTFTKVEDNLKEHCLYGYKLVIVTEYRIVKNDYSLLLEMDSFLRIQFDRYQFVQKKKKKEQCVICCSHEIRCCHFSSSVTASAVLPSAGDMLSTLECECVLCWDDCRVLIVPAQLEELSKIAACILQFENTLGAQNLPYTLVCLVLMLPP